MSPWKKWSWMKSNSLARPSTVFLFYYTSIFTILQPLGSGYHKMKVNELPDWDWAWWSDGTKAAHWGSRKGYRCECFCFVLFCFAALHPTFKHAPWKESMIKRSVVDLELFDDQRRKSARIIWFLSSPWSGFRQLSTACKSMTQVATNEECFSSEIWEIAVFLYTWLVSPWELPDKTGTWS